MIKLNVSLEKTLRKVKPAGKEVGAISNVIADCYRSISLQELANLVGNHGCTFSPAVFSGKRCASNLTEVQLLALDFDNKKLSLTFDEAISRADKLDLPIAFAYETFSSTNCSKFRIIFRYFEPIVDMRFYSLLYNVLLELFPEADHATKDPSRIFFGGKRLLGDVSEEALQPTVLFSALYRHFDEMKKGKVTKLKSFAQNNKIAIINDTFKVGNLTYNEVKTLAEPIIYNKANIFPDKEIFVVYESSGSANIPSAEKASDERFQFSQISIRDIGTDNLINNCMLIRAFYEDTYWLRYPEIWGILTNLIHIKGGRNFFKKLIKNAYDNSQYTYDYDKWDANLRQVTKCPYGPSKCNNFCSFHEQCIHGTNIISTVKTAINTITTLNNKIKYTDIHTARAQLSQYLYSAYKDTDSNSVHIIKAQTGIGKTHAYINLIKMTGSSFIIAVPTNALKDEVLSRLLSEGVKAVATPAIPTDIGNSNLNKIEEFFKRGDYHGYSNFLKELEKQFDSIKQYKKELSKTKAYAGTIVTTHQRLPYIFSPETLKTHQIIIDEDIINTIFKTEVIDRKSISYLITRKYLSIYALERLKYFSSENSKNYGLYKKHIRLEPINLPTEVMDRISNDPNIDWNVENFLNADATMATETEVYYAWITNLPMQKLIILSATIDDQVYAGFFKNRHIKFYKTDSVRYKGKIIQYTDKSYSRAWINQHINQYDKITEYYKHKDCYSITFKLYSSDDDPLHFGNTEGMDEYSDKDLLVFGTPYHNELVYKFMAAVMDYDIQAINSAQLNHRLVEQNEYRFYFFTYDDPVLQRIQLYLISAALEQSVGRARLINNDNTVYVYSNMPVSQARFENPSKI